MSHACLRAAFRTPAPHWPASQRWPAALIPALITLQASPFLGKGSLSFGGSSLLPKFSLGLFSFWEVEGKLQELGCKELGVFICFPLNMSGVEWLGGMNRGRGRIRENLIAQEAQVKQTAHPLSHALTPAEILVFGL